ncbi:MAG: glycoside hydrolase family 27 protein [Lachnospiraceae bacterium]|nr:glycoside hydrolase family 27 protein [Lachnospiraceae bacterium]
MNNIKTPPMGWNSYDYYDTTVDEEQVKANAEYMAKNMKKYGWEYVVVDIEWYSYNAGTRRAEHQYIPFEDVEIDEYSRLLPCPQRFPSAVNGVGFKPLADYVHSLGLKFGIHIMRGIPRIAAHKRMALLGTDITADDIANPYNICYWNPDMYGLCVEKPEAQLYYDSICKLYAEWGVDFIKCDDICRMDAHTSKEEIKMLSKAIKNSGRNMVLSLSPGPAKPEEAWFYNEYSNMWRITDDFWDRWDLLRNMFDRCEIWQDHVKAGGYPDCDMIPVGKLGKGFGEIRDTRFTKDEQITMMTLWCLFRSPLMIGANLPDLDEWTFKLLTNAKVLEMVSDEQLSTQTPVQIMKDDNQAVWYSYKEGVGCPYVALFNLSEEDREVSVELNSVAGLADFDFDSVKEIEELWTGDKYDLAQFQSSGGKITDNIRAHAAKLYRLG